MRQQTPRLSCFKILYKGVLLYNLSIRGLNPTFFVVLAYRLFYFLATFFALLATNVLYCNRKPNQILKNPAGEYPEN